MTQSPSGSNMLNNIINKLNSYTTSFNSVYNTIQKSGFTTSSQQSTLVTLTKLYIDNLPSIFINNPNTLLYPFNLPLDVISRLCNKFPYITDTSMISVLGLATVLNPTTYNQVAKISSLLKLVTPTNSSIPIYPNNYIITGLDYNNALEFSDNSNVIIYIGGIPSDISSTNSTYVLRAGDYIEFPNINAYLVLISENSPVIFNITTVLPTYTDTPSTTPSITPSNSILNIMTPTVTPTPTSIFLSNNGSIILSQITNSINTASNLYSNESDPQTFISAFTSYITSQLISDVIQVDHIPPAVITYYSNIVNNPILLLGRKISCITGILNNNNTQAIKYSSLIQTTGNLVLTPLEPGDTLKIYNDNNILVTSIYRGKTNDNSLQISQDNGPWLNIGSIILVNKYQFKLVALGSPGLWDSLGELVSATNTTSTGSGGSGGSGDSADSADSADSRGSKGSRGKGSTNNASPSLSLTSLIPHYYDDYPDNFYYHKASFVGGIILIFFVILYGVYRSHSENNKKYEEYDDYIEDYIGDDEYR